MNKAAALSGKYDNTTLKASIYQVFALYYNTIKNYNEALIYGEKALKLIKEIGNIPEEIRCLKEISNSIKKAL